MKVLKTNRSIIKVNDQNIKDHVIAEINKWGQWCDLNHIDVSKVTSMSSLFYYSPFNGDIDQWDVKNVKYMSNMFGKSQFDGDISRWNIENVLHMNGMFFSSNFNGNISRWNPKSLTYIYEMFVASKFSGNIDNWNPINIIIGKDDKYVGDNKWVFQNSPIGKNPPKWWILMLDFEGFILRYFKTWFNFKESIRRFGWLKDNYIYFKRLEVALESYDFDDDLVYLYSYLRSISSKYSSDADLDLHKPKLYASSTGYIVNPNPGLFGNLYAGAYN